MYHHKPSLFHFEERFSLWLARVYILCECSEDFYTCECCVYNNTCKRFDLHPEEDYLVEILEGTTRAQTYGLTNRTAWTKRLSVWFYLSKLISFNYYWVFIDCLFPWYLVEYSFIEIIFKFRIYFENPIHLPSRVVFRPTNIIQLAWLLFVHSILYCCPCSFLCIFLWQKGEKVHTLSEGFVKGDR